MLFLFKNTLNKVPYFFKNCFLEQQYDKVSEETADETNLKLFTVRSQIKVTATSNDDRARYKCEAHHTALSDPLSTTVQIRVLCEFS